MNTNDYALGRAQEILRELETPHGFLASTASKDNYKRIFARDGVITGIAALLVKEKDLIDTFKSTLQTLKQFQGEEGEIPSNVSVDEGKTSYGGTTGRVDATLWYVIGVSQYIKYTHDWEMLEEFTDSVSKCIEILESWEFNEKNLIYIPQGGDWADEYINEGYVLYDEILYYKALEEYGYLLRKKGEESSFYDKKAKTLKNIINVNFWPVKEDKDSEYVYHEGIFQKLLERTSNSYFISSFSPGGFKDKFDSLGNSLSILLGVANEDQTHKIIEYVKENFGREKHYMVPAFWPVITENETEWTILKTNYSFSFKNYPHQYHNGGLWPLTTGITAAAIAQQDKERAKYYLQGTIYGVGQDEWGFREFIDGKTFEAKGTRILGFSAAATVIAYEAVINDRKILR